jgi:hypothetical protein
MIAYAAFTIAQKNAQPLALCDLSIDCAANHPVATGANMRKSDITAGTTSMEDATA